MFVKEFASIGNSTILNAIGLQKNHKDTYQELNRELTGCKSCPTYITATSLSCAEDEKSRCHELCNNCPKRIYSDKYRYVNEKNKHGYKPMLKQNAIKILLAYHLLGISQKGVVENVNIKELAELVHCSVRTVKNSNLMLEKYGYIRYSGKTVINVFIPEFDTYYLPAQQGGRGFLRFSKDIFDCIVEMRDVNSIRIAIRGLIEFSKAKTDAITAVSSKVVDIRQGLPTYCKPNIVRNAAVKIPIFNTSLSNDCKVIKFELKHQFNVKQQKENQSMFYINQINSFIRSLNDEIVEVNTNRFIVKESMILPELLDYPDLESKSLMVIKKEIDLIDLSYLCMNYSYYEVENALKRVYLDYYMSNNYLDEPKKIHNLPGLVCSFIKAKFTKSLSA